MNIDWVIPCRYLEVHGNLGTLVGAGIDTISTPHLPADVQVLMAVRLLAVAEELGEDHEHTAKNIVTDPSGKVIGEEQAGFKIGMESPRTEWLNGFMLQSAAVFRAEQEGTYTIEHLVDGLSTKSVPIHVVTSQPG